MRFLSKERVLVPRRWLLAAGLAIALVAGSFVTLWHLRQDAIDGQAQELGLLSLALTEELDRGLRGAEEGLQAIRLELRDARLAVTGAEAERALRTRADLMPLVQTLWLVDGAGRLLAASESIPPPAIRTFSPALEQLGADAIATSRPFIGTGTQEPLVALAFAFTLPEGGKGWIMAAIPAPVMLGAFSVASSAADARMAVFRGDGARLAGSIVATPTLDEASIARRLTTQGTELRTFRDGGDRLVIVQGLPRYGLKVMLTRDLDAVLAPWREVARITGAGLALLLAALMVAAYLVSRADRRHAEAQLALETQLARSSKLQALGTLAGGVAHDFNNVLAAIVGFGEMAREAAAEGSEQARELDKVLQAALRGKALVERIMAFSRGGAHASIVFEMKPIVEEVLTLLGTSLRSGVILEIGFEVEGARVRGDPTQVFEAVMNLCTNAMQAMPDGGTLGIHLNRSHVSSPRVLSHGELAVGEYLALTVSDEGVGITPEIMERLFEPFFTTRDAKTGTGLGLSVVHGVVTELGGAVDVQSAAGHGARFMLYIPECAEAIGSAPSDAVISLPGSGQRLLVVDDDPALVEVAVKALKGLGYEPVGFSDPAAALEAVRADPKRFDAVITDEVMPGLSGTQLTQAFRVHAPHVPVLLVSGYGGAMLASRAAAAGVTRVLSKPLQRAELARALTELLR